MSKTQPPRILFLHLGPKSYQAGQYIDVLESLHAKGAEIHIWCRYDSVLEAVQKNLSAELRKKALVVKLFRPVEIIFKRSFSRPVIIQFFVWLICRLAHPFARYDVILSDNDYEAISYTAGHKTRLYTMQVSIDIFDTDYCMSQHIIEGWPRNFREKLHKIFDSLTGNRHLPKWNGKPLCYYRYRIYTDYIFGLTPYPPIKKGLGTSSGIFLAGNKYKENYERLGVKPEKIEITGMVEHDYLFKAKKYFSTEKRSDFLKQIGINRNQKIITYFGSFKHPGKEGFDRKDFLVEAADICKALFEHYKEHLLVFKPHPYYNPIADSFEADFRVCFSDSSRMIVLDKVLSIEENINLILCSEFVVAPGTLGLTAALLDKSVVTYAKNDPQWLATQKTFRHSFLLDQVDLPQEISQFEIWRKQDNTDYIKTYFNLDGQAVARIAETILQGTEHHDV